ncbi:MAG: helix-turn-helix domain-containing protein [Acetobacteraceae bacterium]|nr:helix-turn-helix domain-containing protein [Acetobacteraceae bacterium]
MQPPVSTPEPGSAWHPADALTALKKRSRTLAGLSITHGYHATAAGRALRTP